jgi:hypothetical protein
VGYGLSLYARGAPMTDPVALAKGLKQGEDNPRP